VDLTPLWLLQTAWLKQSSRSLVVWSGVMFTNGALHPAPD
jgi:hypothetical protein